MHAQTAAQHLHPIHPIHPIFAGGDEMRFDAYAMYKTGRWVPTQGFPVGRHADVRVKQKQKSSRAASVLYMFLLTVLTCAAQVMSLLFVIRDSDDSVGCVRSALFPSSRSTASAVGIYIGSLYTCRQQQSRQLLTYVLPTDCPKVIRFVPRHVGGLLSRWVGDRQIQSASLSIYSMSCGARVLVYGSVHCQL
ncbi:hypothetical protein HDK77DRAFT_242364 [Phyllosticta capitalensis]